MNTPFSDSSLAQPADPAFALKSEARQLRAEARAQGQELTHAQALERVAHRRGFRDWNALSAHLSAGGAPDVVESTIYAWQQLDTPLPTLPSRILRPSQLKHHTSIAELMRWAKQLEFAADKVAEADRAEMMELIGERTPYVLEKSLPRWPDGRHYLCDRGYDVYKGVAFSDDQVKSLGLTAWNEAYGQHDGKGSFTVVGDSLRYTRDVTRLKQMARLLASLAIEADLSAAAAADPGGAPAFS
jgi:hypothetical protein